MYHGNDDLICNLRRKPKKANDWKRQEEDNMWRKKCKEGTRQRNWAVRLWQVVITLAYIPYSEPGPGTITDIRPNRVNTNRRLYKKKTNSIYIYVTLLPCVTRERKGNKRRGMGAKKLTNKVFIFYTVRAEICYVSQLEKAWWKFLPLSTPQEMTHPTHSHTLFNASLFHNGLLM